MSESKVVPVILSGGSGTRLWPMSLPEKPKQFLSLTGDATMLQLTASRVREADGFAPPLVVANAGHSEMVKQQLEEIGVTATVILEPAARNTAPAIALAALAAGGAQVPLLIMPSDHVIGDVRAFHDAINAALPLVNTGWLVTFGIRPERPETGYGWIRIGETLAPSVHRVDQFVEKPARDRAEAMVASGNHAWNGGIFLFRADTYLAALATHAPDMMSAARAAMEQARTEGSRIFPSAEQFARAPSQSIDYAIMEKAERVAVVPVAMNWSDVGSWDALYDVSGQDAKGNSVIGNVTLVEASNCLVRSDGVRVAMLGVSDLVVVSTRDSVLILPRGRSQEIRKLTTAMANSV